MRRLGEAFGTMVHDRSVQPSVVTGHDYRSYSESLKAALIEGMVRAGCKVHDIGLSVTPMAYYAQFALDVPAVAMVTASHNENGWTGVKMGLERPFTLGPGEMADLKRLALGEGSVRRRGGVHIVIDGMRERYIEDLTSRSPLRRQPRVVVACGNGTAGAFAPEALARTRCSVIPLHCDLDFDFPNYNPNPEDPTMLIHLSRAVLAAGADFGLGFDGDGDRCGVVDNEGKAIYADKMGVLLARDLAARCSGAKFLADVKSTALFLRDPVLRERGCTVELWKTGHSYMKRRLAEVNAVAAFEKSGHYFFAPPLGRGYDDGLVSALAICEFLDRSGKSLAELYRELPPTWGSPTVNVHCPDEEKYDVVNAISQAFISHRAEGRTFVGRRIADLGTINGIRVEFEDGSWGLVRASSNKPEIVIVCETPSSPADTAQLLAAVEERVASASGLSRV